jgi:hypothetical protein
MWSVTMCGLEKIAKASIDQHSIDNAQGILDLLDMIRRRLVRYFDTCCLRLRFDTATESQPRRKSWTIRLKKRLEVVSRLLLPLDWYHYDTSILVASRVGAALTGAVILDSINNARDRWKRMDEMPYGPLALLGLIFQAGLLWCCVV